MTKLTESAIEAFATDKTATLKAAWQQIETYKHTIPCLFFSNAFVVISDRLEARAGTSPS
ncbi:hypothetical protein CCP3SC15_80019 [Gammaproteobacteria bacterium]